MFNVNCDIIYTLKWLSIWNVCIGCTEWSSLLKQHFSLSICFGNCSVQELHCPKCDVRVNLMSVILQRHQVLYIPPQTEIKGCDVWRPSDLANVKFTIPACSMCAFDRQFNKDSHRWHLTLHSIPWSWVCFHVLCSLVLVVNDWYTLLSGAVLWWQ